MTPKPEVYFYGMFFSTPSPRCPSTNNRLPSWELEQQVLGQQCTGWLWGRASACVISVSLGYTNNSWPLTMSQILKTKISDLGWIKLPKDKIHFLLSAQGVSRETTRLWAISAMGLECKCKVSASTRRAWSSFTILCREQEKETVIRSTGLGVRVLIWFWFWLHL